nr:hypothetical protein [Clostridium argentinense]
MQLNCTFLVSGYNTINEEEKELYDVIIICALGYVRGFKHCKK